MKAMVFAAGLGTRLKPWTEKHPKALVPVGGVPMLERVLVNLRESGFDDVVVNVHHFADQVTDFLSSHDFGIRVRVSDEREDCWRPHRCCLKMTLRCLSIMSISLAMPILTG